MVTDDLGPTRPDPVNHVHTNFIGIHCRAPPTVACGLEMVCTIATTHTMMAWCKCDASIATGGINLCKFTDPRQLVSIIFANINSGALPVVVGDLGLRHFNGYVQV